MKISYHTHTKRCKHGKGDVLDYVKYANEKGFTILGFTDHVPFFDNRLNFCRMDYNELTDYLDEIAVAKKLYPNIKIYSGFEVEYFDDQDLFYQELLKKVDYLILGQHAIKNKKSYTFIDNCQTKEQLNQYVDYLEKGAKSGYFSLINHPDLFGLAKEQWDNTCIELTHRIANIAIKYDLPLELNAQGMRRGSKIKSRAYPYPLIEFWKIISSDYPHIPIIISSDAHSPNALDDEAVERCKEIAKDLSLNVVNEIKLRNIMTK